MYYHIEREREREKKVEVINGQGRFAERRAHS
jgi:hypothetical protein